MTLKEIFKLIIGWRFLLVLIAIPAMFFLPARTRFTSLKDIPSVSDLSSMWSNFDGLHYLELARFGYGYEHKTDMDYAFFPVYPWAIKTFNIFGNYLVSGLFVSHLAFALALFILYRLILLDHKMQIAKSAIYLLLLFPTAFFFGSVYAESLFLLLVVLSFYFARKNLFFLACLTATIASATKVTGIFLWPAIAYEFWIFYGENIKKALNPAAIWLTLPPLGLLSFLKFQYEKTGDPLFFINYQSNFAERTVDKLILLHQVFFRYAKMLIFVDHGDPLFFTVLLEFLVASLVLLVLIFSFKRIRRSYWIFAVLSYLLPTFTGTFASMPRFTLILFPVFIYLALWLENHHPYIKYAYYTLSVIFGILAVVFFTRGYFIA